ncbi:uncharacterized protein LOC134221593 [Armigeres subalbatus]|uniref:uncharacterized protein LOC134221593 n=1 Tax=Armigeres subalbatus TaxID=124917 RepID=UPI002ED63CE7
MITKYHTRRQKWTTSRDFLRLMSDQLDDGIHTSKQKSCGENPHFSSMADIRSNGRRQGPVVKFSKQRSSSVVLEPVRVRPWQHLCKPHQYRPDAPSLWSRPQPESAANCEGHSRKPFKSEHYHPATSSKQAVQVQSVGQKVSVATVSTWLVLVSCAAGIYCRWWTNRAGEDQCRTVLSGVSVTTGQPTTDRSSCDRNFGCTSKCSWQHPSPCSYSEHREH